MAKLTPEMIESIKEQYKQGVPVPEIASSFGVSRVTVYNYLGDAGLIKQPETGTLRGVRTELYLDGDHLLIALPIKSLASLLLGVFTKK